MARSSTVSGPPVVSFRGVKPVGTYQQANNPPSMPTGGRAMDLFVTSVETPGGRHQNSKEALGIVTKKAP